MGRDKALLELAGKPLVQHAVLKLGRICRRVSVLSGLAELAQYGSLTPDLHPGCGPLSGIEAALTAAVEDWSLILPVDVPFVPTALLAFWVKATVGDRTNRGTRLSFFTVNKIPQPALLMAHRDLLPFVSKALEDGEFKILPVLEAAAETLAAGDGREGKSFGRISWEATAPFSRGEVEFPFRAMPEPQWERLTQAQERAKPYWFSNLNAPEDFAEAERHVDALDT